jgi:hypothetical protein
MNRRLTMSLVLGVMLVLSAGVVWAQQEAPAPPPRGAGMMQGGDMMAPPMGDKIELLGFAGMHGGKTVTGAPFSAVAVSVTTQTLSDGNQISRKTQTNLFRDSQGRFRKEVSFGAIGPLATSGAPKSFVFINDPVTKENFILHPDAKTAEKVVHSHGGMRGMKGPHSDAAGAANGNTTGWEAKAAAMGNFKKEDLGTQMVAGVSAQGTRYTRTIPVGQIGNEKVITIVSEHWYSADLQMTVMSKRSDPRYGETSYSLTNIQRTEPAASLFAVPSDYTVKQQGMGHRGMRMKQAPTAAPPADNN